MNEIRAMMMLVAVVCCIVFLAMVLDLVSGIMKAKQRGEARTSYGLSRSISKFVMYEGGVLIGAGIDILMHISSLLPALGLGNLANVPVITCVIGIFLLVTEFLSMREKADEKMRRNFNNTAELLQTLFSKEELKELIKNKLEKTEK